MSINALQGWKSVPPKEKLTLKQPRVVQRGREGDGTLGKP